MDMDKEEISQLLKELSNETQSGAVLRALRLSAESLSALYSLAYYLYENGKFMDAKNIFRLMTLSDPFDRRYWMGLAASYQMMKDYDTALECYGVAAVQDSDDTYVHLHAADCFFAKGETDKAVKTLQSALVSAKKIKDERLCSQLLLMQASWTGQLSKEGETL